MDAIDTIKHNRFVTVLTVAVSVAPLNTMVHTFEGCGHDISDAEQAALRNFKTNGRAVLAIPAKTKGAPFDELHINGVARYINANWERCTATITGFTLKDF